jgi:Pyruvate:ferredoxin oxidoreductase and related 2-oxoacid:ferredoxin oxidoreductases, gamma subunit
MKWEITLAGSGGQGLILGGIILAEAGMFAGFNAVQSQVYGPEARGGSSKADCIISDEEIDFPRIAEANTILAMSQEAYETYRGTLTEDGIIITDNTFVDIDDGETATVWQLPITSTTREKFGRPIVANIVALGCVAAICGTIPREYLEKAVMARAPKGTEEMNRQALAEGYELGESAVKDRAQQ